jgi:hypothetical protein
MGRRMGYIMPKKFVMGEARDVETIVRLRPWIEDEWRSVHGQFRKTTIQTDYDVSKDIFKFKIFFNI